jgi:hypothetical protein
MSRINIWIVIAILLVLFAVTRYVMHKERFRISAPTTLPRRSANAEGRSRTIEKPRSPFLPALLSYASANRRGRRVTYRAVCGKSATLLDNADRADRKPRCGLELNKRLEC